MISDVLFQALDDIRGYLDDPAFAEMYELLALAVGSDRSPWWPADW